MGFLTRETFLAVAFRPMMSTTKKWRRLSGANRLSDVVQGVEVKDGIKRIHVAA